MINDYSNLSERDIAKLLNNSIKPYPLFAKSMEDKTDKRYYSNLIQHWKESEEKRIELCNLQEVSREVLVWFHSFYTRIFRVYYYMHQYYKLNSNTSLTRMNIELCRFENGFIEIIKNLVDAINNCVLSGNYEKAIRIKNYEISLFRSIEVHIANAYINLEKSPFFAVFEYGRKELSKSINIQEVDISSRLITNINQEIINTDSVNGELEKTIGIKDLAQDISSSSIGSDVPNDFIKSTIEDYLEDFKDKMFEKQYKLLVQSMQYYFENNEFGDSNEVITFKSKVNLKKVGWALKELCHAVNGTLGQVPTTFPIEILDFAKERISIYKDTPYDKSNPRKSTLYSYFHTKP